MNNRRKTVTIASNATQNKSGKRNDSSISSLSTHCLNGVNNLRPKCEQTLALIAKNANNDSVIAHERQLWNEIKEYRHENNIILIDYLIGFYVTLLESVLIHSSRGEPYITTAANCQQLSSTARFLLYNILIRIGDLNRYLHNTSVAETYYLNAKRLDPMRGHAYNQLAIVTPLSEPFKCIYYSARAAKSCVDPTVVAETNLKMAINRFNTSILKKLFKLSASVKEDNSDEYPQKGIDWFYLSTIAIYSDNLKPIFKPLIDHILTCCGVQAESNTNLSYSLMAFDVLLDWVTIRDMKKYFAEEYTKELRELKAKLKLFSETSISDGVNTASESSAQNWDSVLSSALFHDYVLRGFAPLKEIHQNLIFEINEVLTIDLNKLNVRVNDKLDKLLLNKLAQKPRKIRNVALGSILEREHTSD